MRAKKKTYARQITLEFVENMYFMKFVLICKWLSMETFSLVVRICIVIRQTHISCSFTISPFYDTVEQFNYMRASLKAAGHHRLL